MNENFKKALNRRELSEDIVIELVEFVNMRPTWICIEKPMESDVNRLKLEVNDYNETVGNPEEEAIEEFQTRLLALLDTTNQTIFLRPRKLKTPLKRCPTALAETVVRYNKIIGNTGEDAVIDAIVRLYCLGVDSPKLDKFIPIIEPFMKKYYP